MQKLNALTALSLSAILVFSMLSVSNAQFDDEEIVKVRVKQGKTLLMLLVKSSEDFGLDIYGFSVKLTNGSVKGLKAPKMWTGEHDSSDPNTINFSTKDKPIPAGKGAVFRLRVDTQSPAFDWTAWDEDHEEIDSGVAGGKWRGPTMERPVPMPAPPVSTAERAAALSVSPERTMPGSAIKIAGKGFAPDSQVAIMLDESDLGKAETDSNGQFVTEAVIPNDISFGMHKVRAEDTAGNFARAAIMVVEHEKPQRQETLVRDLAVKTESDHYPQGGTVVIVGHGTPNSTVELQVMDPAGEVVFSERAGTDGNGMFGVKMSLGAEAQSGKYVVYAKQEGQGARSMFMVMSREKPMTTAAPVLTVNTEHERYHKGDTVVIFGRAGHGTVGIAVMHGEATNIAGSMVFRGEAIVSMDGSYKTTFTLNDVREGTYLVMAQQGGVNARTMFFVAPSEKGEEFDDTNKYSGELKIYTDKEHYKTGETITIFGEHADPEKTIELVVYHSEIDSGEASTAHSGERVIYKDFLTPNSDGSFRKTSPPITPDVEPGVYTVIVMQHGSSAKVQFKIEA